MNILDIVSFTPSDRLIRRLFIPAPQQDTTDAEMIKVAPVAEITETSLMAKVLPLPPEISPMAEPFKFSLSPSYFFFSSLFLPSGPVQ